MKPSATAPPWLGSLRSYFSTEAVNAVSTLVGVLVFTRLVDPVTYGQYSVALAAASFAMALAGEWLQTSTLRLVSGQERVIHRQMFARALLDLTLASIGVLTMGALIGALLARTPNTRLLVGVGWLYAALSILFVGTTIYFQATFQPHLFARYRSAYSVLRVVFAALLCTIIAPTAGWLLAGSVVALAVLLPPAAVYVARGLPRSAPPARLAAARAAIARFGAPLILWFAASQTLNLSDRFFLQALRGSADVGTYSVSYALVVGVTTTVLQPVLAAAYPRMVRAWHNGGPTAAAEQFGLAIHAYLLLAPLIVCGITIFGGDVLAILVPSAYHTDRAVLALLTAALLCWNAGLYFQKGLELGLKSGALVQALAIGATVNVAANLLLIPQLGILGAAAATLLGYATYAGAVLVLAHGVLPMQLSARLLGAVSVAGGTFVGVSLLLGHWAADWAPWTRLLLSAPLATGAYAAVLHVTGALRPLIPQPRLHDSFLRSPARDQ